MISFRNTINKGSEILKKNFIETANIDAELLLSFSIKQSREKILLNLEKKLDYHDVRKYFELIERRKKKEPISLIIGKKTFWKCDFYVNKDVLTPRKETEFLIEEILTLYKNSNKISVLDIGTGSGCIILSILNSLKFSRGVGIDISSKAIEIAKANSKRMKLSNRVKFKVLDLAKIYGNQFDLVVSNPPYIPLKDIKNLSKDIRNYEPIIALNGGVDGLDLVKKVIYKSIIVLKKNGLLAIEIGNGQYRKVSNLLKNRGFKELSKEYDYKDNVRCIISTKL